MAQSARMSLENDDNPASKPKDLVFILAIAGRIDAQNRNFAKGLHNNKKVYYFYAGADSLSSSYSMFKYFFDICIGNPDPNALHDIMLTPAGIIAISIESAFLFSFAVLAAVFDNDESKKNSLKKFIVEAWPYFRHVIKGLKNAYKGWRSAVVALSLIGGLDIKYLILPIGLGLGVLAVANRLGMYYLTEARKDKMKANYKLLLEITKFTSPTKEDRKSRWKQIQYQELWERICGYISVGLGGLVDGLYLYVGVLTLAALSAPLLTTMAIICAFYTLACIVTRLYEEYDFQVKLFISQTQCKLAFLSKRLETSYMALLTLKGKSSKTQSDLLKLKELEQEVFKLINKFEKKRIELKYHYSLTHFSAILLGLKHGLYAYGALCSIIFLTSAIIFLAGATFPPALLLFSVFAGLALITGFIIHSLVVNSRNLKTEAQVEDDSFNKLLDMKEDIAVIEGFANLIEIEAFRRSLKDGLTIKPTPQFFYQEWFEVVRSIFSGLGKGQKFIDFAGNPLQELDEQGHYHDTPIMYVLAVYNAVVFAAALGLRALARGFGRPPIGGDVKLTDAVTLSVKVAEPVNEAPNETTKVEAVKEPGSPIKSQHDSKKLSQSDNPHGLFYNKSKVGDKPNTPRAHIPQSKSEQCLVGIGITEQNKVQGLT